MHVVLHFQLSRSHLSFLLQFPTSWPLPSILSFTIFPILLSLPFFIFSLSPVHHSRPLLFDCPTPPPFLPLLFSSSLPQRSPPLSPVLSTLYFTCTVHPCLLSSSFTNAPCAFVSPHCLSPPLSPVPLTAAFPFCLHPPPSPLHPSTLTLAILTPPFSRTSRRTHHVT